MFAFFIRLLFGGFTFQLLLFFFFSGFALRYYFGLRGLFAGHCGCFAFGRGLFFFDARH
jgi:hypothetical protein